MPSSEPPPRARENRVVWSLLAAFVGACIGLVAAGAAGASLWKGAVACAAIGGVLGFALGSGIRDLLRWWP